MNLADYLILAVIAQLFWVIKKIMNINATINILRSRCPLLNSRKEKENELHG